MATKKNRPKFDDVVVDHDGSIGDQLSKDIKAMSEEEREKYFLEYGKLLTGMYGD